MTAGNATGQLPLPISLDQGATFENFYAVSELILNVGVE